MKVGVRSAGLLGRGLSKTVMGVQRLRVGGSSDLGSLV